MCDSAQIASPHTGKATDKSQVFRIMSLKLFPVFLAAELTGNIDRYRRSLPYVVAQPTEDETSDHLHNPPHGKRCRFPTGKSFSIAYIFVNQACRSWVSSLIMHIPATLKPHTKTGQKQPTKGYFASSSLHQPVVRANT